MSRRDPLPPPFGASLSRRGFVKVAALGGAALVLPPALRADPYAPVAAHRAPGVPVRVRGRVQAAGRGVRGVGVTDGRTFALTDAEGRYTLLSDAARAWVSLSLPAGYQIPIAQTGTARTFQPLRANGAGEATAEFELARLAASDERHAFLVLADPQTQNAFEMERFHGETVPDVRATVAALGDVPLFGVGCGDLMFDDLALFPEYERAVAGMGVPFFQVVGNHDLDFAARTDDGSTDTFQRHFGPPHYSFERGEVHYVVLDDVFWHGAGYLGYLTDVQLAWLAADLARVEAGRTVVVFVHIPVLGTRFRRMGERNPSPAGAVMNREALYRLLEPYRAHVMSGHTHDSEHVFEGGVHEHVHGTVCGAWWSGDICYDGTPNGYGVYEAHGSELRWRYKATAQPADHQLRVYGRGADQKAPTEIVANVWDWEPEWTVVWYEDGERRGSMARRTGLDPLSVKLHAGDELPERRPWVDPLLTDHLFYAPVSPAAREVRVEATDRWGRTYAGTVPAASYEL